MLPLYNRINLKIWKGIVGNYQNYNTTKPFQYSYNENLFEKKNRSMSHESSTSLTEQSGVTMI